MLYFQGRLWHYEPRVYLCIQDLITALRKVTPEWHGDLMYTIRRAFTVLGALQAKFLDPEIKRQLQELLDLYAMVDLSSDDDDSLLKSLNCLDRGLKRQYPG